MYHHKLLLHYIYIYRLVDSWYVGGCEVAGWGMAMAVVKLNLIDRSSTRFDAGLCSRVNPPNAYLDPTV